MSSLDYAVTPVDIGLAAPMKPSPIPLAPRSRNAGRLRLHVRFPACSTTSGRFSIPAAVVARATFHSHPYLRGITRLPDDPEPRTLGVRLFFGGGYGGAATRTRRAPFGRVRASLHSQEAQIRALLSHRGARYKVHLYCRKLRKELLWRMGEVATYQVHASSADNRVLKVQLQAIAKGPVQRTLQETTSRRVNRRVEGTVGCIRRMIQRLAVRMNDERHVSFRIVFVMQRQYYNFND
ncbi:hypothetical protein EDB89DRAFT_806210 [Lactarius sanguifluus]|nr:hypothetical protein EDB89DRAFT_806210 [Lactarius sanguifluus]